MSDTKTVLARDGIRDSYDAMNLLYSAARVCEIDTDAIGNEIERYDLFYRLARGVPFGRIVELGAGKGMDCVPLMVGAGERVGVHVHAVDWYSNCVGLNGEVYKNSDFKNYYNKIMRVMEDYKEPLLHIASFARFADDWSWPIGLLIWDGNVTGPQNDIGDLEMYVGPGGVVAFVDTADDGWVAKEVANRYVSSGFYERVTEVRTTRNNIYVIRKRVKCQESARNSSKRR